MATPAQNNTSALTATSSAVGSAFTASTTSTASTNATASNASAASTNAAASTASTVAHAAHAAHAAHVAHAGGAATEILPSANALIQAAKISIEQDREIKLDYFRQTANGTAFLGMDPETKERVLLKSKEEFTSLIKKVYKVGEDIIVLTENSLYIVSGKIQTRKVNLAKLQEAYDSSL